MLTSALVSADWLAEHLSDVHVVDVRWSLNGPPGLDAYTAGHIPGAVFLDLDADLSAPPSPSAGRHPLPTEAAFAAALGRMGIAEGEPVVVYDQAGGSVAARLWWMLHVLGEPVAVLDGGLAAWPGELSTQVPVPVPVRRPVREWPAQRFADADRVAAGGAFLIDARADERYAEGDPAVDPRPGHIPGAVNLPWAGNLGPDGRFLEPAALRERFAEVDGQRVVAYCGSGVTACHDLLALHLAGYDNTALYPGSWSQWGADASRPARTGSAP